MDTTRKRLSFFLFGYLAFVVYGSLVPLAFTAMPFELAWQRFLDIPWLKLGAMSRADWIANILLYMPLSGVLFLLILRQGLRSVLISTVVTLFFCLALALSVEFLQVYFPPRTVSLNDLLAEFLGTIIGISIAAFAKTIMRLRDYQAGILSNSELFLSVYILSYLALSLFPFDFVISRSELQEKVSLGRIGLITATGGCDQFYLCGFKLLFEVLLTIPIGLLIAARKGRVSIGQSSILLWALMFGTSIELLQALVLSGISQGVSVVSKALGIVLGSYMWSESRVIVAYMDRVKPRKLVTLLGVPYIIGLLVANRWFETGWIGSADAIDKLQGLSFLSFYYHYFTTETVAMVSLLFYAGLYSPVGLAVALIQKYASEPRVALTVAWAGLFSFLIEGAKLFQLGERPDPTNIIIAITAAVITQLLAFRLLSITLTRHRNLQCAASAGRE